jgi:hypothetical protein
MTGQRLLGFSILLSLATACVPAVNQSLAPQRGPKARIHASFTGGITSRNAQARFTVDDDAYVMVGHLGGDGYVRILYPTSPLEQGLARKGKTYATENVYAAHDAIPALYQARTVRYRHVSARMDSYDGAGNGYFFLIASRYRLHFDEISMGGFFDIIEVPDYYDTYDPRLTIKALGDLVSRGSPYTLEFAGSFGTVDYSNYSDQRWDCLTLSMFHFGLSGYEYTPYYLFGSRSLRNSLSCGNQFAYGLGRYRYAGYDGFSPSSTVTPTPPRAGPRGTIRPPWQRRALPPRRSTASSSRSFLPQRINDRREATRSIERASSRARARESHDRAQGAQERARASGSSGSSSQASRGAAASSGAARETERASAPRAQPSGAGRSPSPSPSTERKREP